MATDGPAAQQQTPMMRQYLAFKRRHEDAILLFRMGDFYEMFFDDAKTAARVLGLAITSRSKGPDAVPMAGFPHHAADNYIRKLIEAGLRVAVCDQIQDPSEARGLVDRDVTRIITAGTLTEDSLLDGRAHNYLAAVLTDGGEAGVAWLDLSTGLFEIERVPREALAGSLARLHPREVLRPQSCDEPLESMVAEGTTLTLRPDWEFGKAEAYRVLLDHFQTRSLDGFGCEGAGPALGAAGAVIAYLRETQKTTLAHIRKLSLFSGDRFLQLDRTTQSSLELVRTMRSGDREGSLLSVLDQTVTPMGARLLRTRILTPLRDPAEISARHDVVAEFHASPTLRQHVRGLLANVADIERLTTRISCNRASARDLVALRHSLEVMPELSALLAASPCGRLAALAARLDRVPEACGCIGAAIVGSPPATVRDGGLIQDGYSEELDELRGISRHGKGWITEFEAAETARTGIPSLKVGYNKVFGYYIEVTNTHRDKVPANYTRKQTLKNAERFVTPELKEWETKVLSADERMRELEYFLFQQVREEVARHTERLQQTAAAVAELDLFAALANVAAENRYVRPVVTDGLELDIRDGRHPVLETIMDERFVPNDCIMDGGSTRMLIITGPNMAGKSVYIRQTALIVLMAQIGSFVPAKAARIGVVDRLFTRVGASDEQARGQSTFMVEMTEVANILNNATERSLIILDEVGRGTSTFDGVSIAWSVSEFIHERIGARTLFATHYHELSQLAGVLPRVRNLNVAVREWQDEVVFLHRIVEGSADKSYGIHVARLAGVPRDVLERARTILEELEASALDMKHAPRLARGRPGPRSKMVQLQLFKPLSAEIRDDLLSLDLAGLSREQAIEALAQLRRKVEEEG